MDAPVRWVTTVCVAPSHLHFSSCSHDNTSDAPSRLQSHPTSQGLTHAAAPVSPSTAQAGPAPPPPGTAPVQGPVPLSTPHPLSQGSRGSTSSQDSSQSSCPLWRASQPVSPVHKYHPFSTMQVMASLHSVAAPAVPAPSSFCDVWGGFGERAPLRKNGALLCAGDGGLCTPGAIVKLVAPFAPHPPRPNRCMCKGDTACADLPPGHSLIYTSLNFLVLRA